MLIKTTKFYTLLLGIGAVSFLQAQIQNPIHVEMGVADPSDNEILTALRGPKVILSNPKLIAGDKQNQIRTFSGGLAAGLQMDTGVLFNTGWASEVFSANESIGELNNGENVRYDDPDLQKIPGNEEVHTDVVAYEFDVTIPNTATAINVAYQFGSEEYASYVGSKYNDAFAFFVSGPGIDKNTEGNINGKINMARIEHNGVNVPTSINTINQGIYGPDEDNRRDIDPNVVTDYYINNGHNEEFSIRNGKKYYTKFTYIDIAQTYNLDFDASQVKVHTSFNGITKKIDYALKGLQPGKTYRFKIIIGDAFDGSMDSGVFIDAISAFADIEARNNNYTIDAGSTSTTSVLANDVYKGNFGTVTENNVLVQVKEKTLPREFVTISTPFNIVKVETDGTKTNSSGFTLDNDGNVIVDSSVAPGTYEFDYNICDAANPDFCSTAKVTVVVKAGTPPTEQKCYKPGNFTAQGEPSKFGISTIGQPNTGWPKNIPNGHIVMESKEKGFVITQVANVSAITNSVEGMLVYDLTDQCVKLYNGSAWKCLTKSCD